jgi:methylated-DNA-protein-cysteine methyltransferase-like protein
MPRPERAKPQRRSASSSYERIYTAVRKVPRGRVTTYGAIARLSGIAGQARLVGYALSALPSGSSVPWHRVINAQGKLSLERSASGAGITQRLRLEREGVRVDAAGRVPLDRYGWPRPRPSRRGTTATRASTRAAT